MIELLRGSFGDDQPRFMVLVNQAVTPDQIDKIAELLNKIAEEGRAQAADQLTDQVQGSNMGYANEKGAE